MVPDELRGRVMAVYSMMFMGMAPFGALMGGALADRLGAPLTVAMGGVACMGGAVWFGLSLPKIRVEARRLIVAQAVAGGEPYRVTRPDSRPVASALRREHQVPSPQALETNDAPGTPVALATIVAPGGGVR